MTGEGRKPALTSDQRRAVRSFALANAANNISRQVICGQFLCLFAHGIGFSSVRIGMLSAMIHAAAIAYIWGARHADRHGCKRQIMTFFGLGPLALFPLLLAPQIKEWLGDRASVSGIFIGLAAYSLCTVIGMSAWMPLLRHNLPADRKAQLVGRINRISMSIGAATTLLCSLFLGKDTPVERFQVLFLGSALIAMSRAPVLRRLRDTERTAADEAGPLGRDLRELWANPAFRRLVILMCIFYLAAGLVAPFRAIYLTELGFSDSFAAFATTAMMLIAYALVTQKWGIIADRYGSRGIYVIAGIGVIIAQLVMILPRANGLLDGVIVVAGLAGVRAAMAGIDAGNIHRMFTVVPRRNQSLYLVFYMLSISVSMAIGSFVGGHLIRVTSRVLPEEIGASRFAAAPDYRIIFLVAAGVAALAVLYSLRLRGLREMSAVRMLRRLQLRILRRLRPKRPTNR